MAISKWFDSNVYMGNKLAQLKETEPAGNWTMDKVVDAFAANGFVGEAGAEAHFMQFGQIEDVAPNAFFNPTEYYRAKAAEVYKKLDNPKSVTETEAAFVKAAIKGLGMGAWGHYDAFGSNEKINPSNGFDTEKYMNAKLTALNENLAAGQTPYKIEDVYAAFQASGISALEHFMTFGGNKQPGEVAEAYNGTIPDAFKVDPAKQVNGGGSSEGTTYTLTIDIDNIPGTSGNDTIIGGAGSADGESTLGAADVINGAEGTDTLKVTMEGSAPSATPNLTSVEIVSAQALSSGGSTINMVNAKGTTTLENSNSTDALFFTNVQELATVSIVKGNNSNTEVKFINSIVAGTADAVSIKLDDARVGFLSAAGSATGGGFETVNINAVAGNSTISVLSTASGNVTALAAALQNANKDKLTIDGVTVSYTTDDATTKAAYATAVNATDASATAKAAAIAAFNAVTVTDASTTATALAAAKVPATTAVTTATNALGAVTNAVTETVNIEGAGFVKIVDLASTVTKIDASKNSGGVDVHIDAGATRDVTITGGSGHDQVRMENTLTTLDKIDGGAGTDTIHVTSGGHIVAGLQVSNFEQLDIAVGQGTYNMTHLAGINALVVSNGLNAAGATVDNFAKGAKIVLGGENTNADLIGAGDLTVNVKDSGAGSARDVIDIFVNSRVGVTSAGGSDLVIANIETVNLTASSDSTNVTHNFAGKLQFDNATTITVKADTAALTIGDLEAKALVEFDASDSAKAVSVTTGADTFTATGGVAFRLGAGNDTLDLTGATGGSTGADFVITGGKGGDAITLASTTNTDHVVYTAGDSLAGVVSGLNQFDSITNFTTATDKIDLTSFSFSGTLIAGVKTGAALDISTTTGMVNTNKQANFFGAGGDQRAVVVIDDSTNSWVFVDANKDGSYQAETDLVIKMVGLTSGTIPVAGDFTFTV